MTLPPPPEPSSPRLSPIRNMVARLQEEVTMSNIAPLRLVSTTTMPRRTHVREIEQPVISITLQADGRGGRDAPGPPRPGPRPVPRGDLRAVHQPEHRVHHAAGGRRRLPEVADPAAGHRRGPARRRRRAAGRRADDGRVGGLRGTWPGCPRSTNAAGRPAGRATARLGGRRRRRPRRPDARDGRGLPGGGARARRVPGRVPDRGRGPAAPGALTLGQPTTPVNVPNSDGPKLTFSRARPATRSRSTDSSRIRQCSVSIYRAVAHDHEAVQVGALDRVEEVEHPRAETP